MHRVLIPSILGIMLALSSCTSIYGTTQLGATQHGHEALPVPILTKKGAESGPSVEESVLALKGSLIPLLYNAEDIAFMGQIGLLHTKWMSVSPMVELAFNGGISAWLGRTIWQGDEDDFTDSAGLIPGAWFFYGGSLQGSTGVRFGDRFGYRVLVNGSASWESGPWARARRLLDKVRLDPLDPDVLNTQPYTNDAPRPVSAVTGFETGFDYRMNDSSCIYFGTNLGVGYPDLMDNRIPSFIFGATLQYRFDDTTLYFMMRQRDVSSISNSVGLYLSL